MPRGAHGQAPPPAPPPQRHGDRLEVQHDAPVAGSGGWGTRTTPRFSRCQLGAVSAEPDVLDRLDTLGRPGVVSLVYCKHPPSPSAPPLPDPRSPPVVFAPAPASRNAGGGVGVGPCARGRRWRVPRGRDGAKNNTRLRPPSPVVPVLLGEAHGKQVLTQPLALGRRGLCTGGLSVESAAVLASARA